MSKSTISTFELFQIFPDQESARVWRTAHPSVLLANPGDWTWLGYEGKQL